MNRWQKIAWFNLIVIAAAFVICIVIAAKMPLKDAITPPSPLTFIIIPALVLVAISEKVIFRKKSEQVDRDERDRQIDRISQHIGWMAFALAMVAGLLLCYLAVGPKGALYPLVLPLMACMGGGVHIMVVSSATLIQYGWGGEDAR
jgi:peptidoglycan/LPS O-acetylase OafA/YrhL